MVISRSSLYPGYFVSNPFYHSPVICADFGYSLDTKNLSGWLMLANRPCGQRGGPDRMTKENDRLSLSIPTLQENKPNLYFISFQIFMSPNCIS